MYLTDDMTPEELEEAALEERRLQHLASPWRNVQVGTEVWRVRRGSIAEALADYAARIADTHAGLLAELKSEAGTAGAQAQREPEPEPEGVILRFRGFPPIKGVGPVITAVE